MLIAIICGLVMVSSIQAQDVRFSEFHRIDSSHGWLLSNNHILSTDSAGVRWQDITPAANVDGVFFSTPKIGWAVTSSATANSHINIARTQDGGKNWFFSSLEDSVFGGGELYAHKATITFPDSLHGWVLLRIATSANFSRGVLLTTNDGGKTWIRLPEPPISDGLSFVTARNGWLAGGPNGDQIFVTKDGGITWNIPVIPRVAPGQISYEPPIFHDGSNGLLIARVLQENNSQVAIFITHDGGATWHLASTKALSSDIGHLAGAAALLDPVNPAGERQIAELIFSSQAFIPGGKVTRMQFLNASEGWMEVVSGHCNGFKTNCVHETHLMASDNSVLTEITPSAAMLQIQQAGPTPFASTTTSGNAGFDQCSAGTVSQMQTWWTSSPYFDTGIYIGGVARACGQPNLTSSWVQSVFSQGWRLMPLWVGPQAPCSTFASRISSTPSTAFNQGVSEGTSAVAAANALGLSNGVIYYDMENYNSGDTTCRAAVNQFISGWVQQLRSSGFHAGVYGSATDANSGWATVTNVPDDVWIALWNGQATTTGLSPLPDSLWSSNQRIHQYQGGHNETWGSVTFNIDNDQENGQVTAP